MRKTGDEKVSMNLIHTKFWGMTQVTLVNNEAESVNTKKNIRCKKHYTYFIPKTPMQNIEFEVGLMFTGVKILKNVIVDDVVE